MSNKRLEMLEKLTQSASADSFAWYGLAMEYRKLGRVDDALSCFETLRERDAEYLPMYLMAGQTLAEAGHSSRARDWLEAGLTLASQKQDQKTRSEIEDALSALES